MRNLHVLMTNHEDGNFTKILIDEIPFIQAHYNTLLVECVPFGNNDIDVLKYVGHVLLTAEFDFSGVKTSLTITQKRALKNAFSKEMDDSDKIALKQQAIITLLEDKRLTMDGPGSPLKLLNIFYYYQFLSTALRAGVQLIGTEASDYRPQANQPHRYQAFVDHVLREATEEGRRCLLLAGATHGVDLIKAPTIPKGLKIDYTQIYCDPAIMASCKETSPAQRFRPEIESGRFRLSENQSYLFLDLTKVKDTEQKDLFRQRVISTSSDLPVYHTDGHNRSDDLGVASKAIARLSHLSFFSSFDQDYFVDTVTEISKPNQLARAISFQATSGLGGFFRTDQGKIVFAVKRTNDPYQFETLRDKLGFNAS